VWWGVLCEAWGRESWRAEGGGEPGLPGEKSMGAFGWSERMGEGSCAVQSGGGGSRDWAATERGYHRDSDVAAMCCIVGEP
jgi:hypothetical protein